MGKVHRRQHAIDQRQPDRDDRVRHADADADGELAEDEACQSPAAATSVDDLGHAVLDHSVQQLEFPFAAGRIELELAEDAVEAADLVEPLVDRFAA